MVKTVLALLPLAFLASCKDECKQLGASWCNDAYELARCESPVKFEIGNQEVTKDCRGWGAVCTAGADPAGIGAECTLPERCAVEGQTDCRGPVHFTCQRGYWVLSTCQGCYVDPVAGARCP